MQDKFAILEEVLKTECGRGPIYYIPNPGNYGDGTIRYGTLKFFHDINLNYRELTNDDKKKGFYHSLERGTVIYGGGGAWCKLWDIANITVTKLSHMFKVKVIVLPSTYELTKSTPRTIFFCRDMFESKKNMANSIFCHDMAFYIGKHFSPGDKGSGKGYFFRTDKESANKIKIPQDNNDISSKGNIYSEIYPFFEEINKFAIIYTDRLHVAIAACLLEKEVHLCPGSYFKNLAVYMSSMKGYFDNVYFHEEFDF
jgi:exopolysaccharide biosynthesis predicted pyruvyltransferase EpsI